MDHFKGRRPGASFPGDIGVVGPALTGDILVDHRACRNPVGHSGQGHFGRAGRSDPAHQKHLQWRIERPGHLQTDHHAAARDGVDDGVGFTQAVGDRLAEPSTRLGPIGEGRRARRDDRHDQCDTRRGTGASCSSARLTPPKTVSRRREWP